MTGRINSIQTLGTVDGPGVRFVLFMQGCPLRCGYCHNPDTWDFAGGYEATAEEIFEKIKRYREYFGKDGGLTVSGGEPFAQNEATVEFLKACRLQGLSTAVETCGYCDTDILLSAIPFVDLFLWDIKDTNPARHKKYTGASNELILKNLNAANEKNARIRLRCILVNGVNTDEEHYKSIARLASGINNFDGIDILPYHAYGGSKALLLGLRDNGKKEWIPDQTQIDRLNSILRNHGIIV